MMMRSATLALLGLLASVPVVCEAEFRTLAQVPPPANSIAVQNRGKRMLQSNVTSFYTAIWYFVHEGSCASTTEPSIVLACDGGDGIAIETQSVDVTCGSVDQTGLTVECTSAAGATSGHAVDFSCTGASLDETTAKATIPEQVDDCLGGDQLAAEWGHGLLLSLVCNDDLVLNGTCTPLNTTFPDSTCTSGWSCPIGNCSSGDYTIVEMTSAVTVNDCTPFGMEEEQETSGSIMSVLSTTVVAVATVTMLVGGW